MFSDVRQIPIHVARRALTDLLSGQSDFNLDALRTYAEKKIPDSLIEPAGSFVCIKNRDVLRGCIGTLSPTKSSFLEEVHTNAVAAASKDPRFPPVRREELGYLKFQVDKIHEMEEISDVSLLDPQRFGVVVGQGARRGVLLPGIEGITDAGQQVEIALRKAGISLNEMYRLFRFEVTRFENS